LRHGSFKKNSPPDKEGLGEVVFWNPLYPPSNKTYSIFRVIRAKLFKIHYIAYHGICFVKTGEIVFISIEALSLIGERANCKVKRVKKAF
tara:strand:- start:412 stop:681 length:270 start_codon:yes stop_codon:yes gene_type:complete